MNAVLKALNPVSNDGERSIEFLQPYVATVIIEGVTAILFHRWSNEAIAEKAKAAKGSKAKKSDDVESYVYRLPDGTLGIPGEYLRMAIINSAKYRQDPRSPRKSAMDLYKAGIISMTDIASTGKKDWDYIDQRRVMVQRNGITRMRPALSAGWQATFALQVQLPEFIPPHDLRDVLINAGRLIGVGDFRPTYGRFSLVKWEVS